MTTAPDMLYHLGGVPVGADNFAGWWGNDVWFVDFDNGIRASQKGKNDMGNPQKDIYQAVTDSAAHDTIYLRPRTTVGTRGTHQTPQTPAATEAANLTIPQTHNHLTIIGTKRYCGLQNGVILEGYAAVNTPTIKVLAPYFTVENVTFQQNSSQLLGSLNVIGMTPGTNDGFGATVNNCAFHVHKSTGYGAILFDSGRYNRCINSHFWHCVVGINLGASAAAIQGAIIQNCDFSGLGTDVDTDIQIATGQHILIDSNRFNHTLPAYTTGAYKKFIQVVTSATGVISNNWFAEADAGFDEAVAQDSMEDVGNKCGADLVWMTST